MKFTITEKRKFNYVMLALLVITVAVGASRLLTII